MVFGIGSDVGDCTCGSGGGSEGVVVGGEDMAINHGGWEVWGAEKAQWSQARPHWGQWVVAPKATVSHYAYVLLTQRHRREEGRGHSRIS